MPKKHDLLVYIGRFQPIHNAHLAIIEEASKLSDRVLVIIGSAFQPRTFKNPFTVEERKSMIYDAIENASFSSGRCTYIVEHNIDTIYDDAAWVVRTQEIVANHSYEDDKIGIIGFEKDPDTARYLKMFPQWDLVKVDHQEVLNATQIRDLYFNDNFSINYLNGVVPPSTLSFLSNFTKTEEYANIVAEKKFIEERIKKKEAYEYPIIAVTVDNVIIQSGHILLVERKKIPGKGLLALPGGYMDYYKDRTPLDGMLRELREETNIDVPDKVLRGSLVQYKEFCAPGRSLLGRSVTFAGHFRLAEGEWKLPKVKGGDDAAKAMWVPLSDLRREELFDDHADIIQYFVPSINL